MLLPLAFALGFVLGWSRARARRLDTLDRVLYGAVHGIILALAALFALVLLERFEVL
jgi:hypothetical protein